MSRKYCCVPGCASSGDSANLHMFPNPDKDPERFRSWVHAIGGDILSLENNWIYKNRRVCHIHFEDKYCYYSHKVSQTAVPTKKLPGLSTIPKYTFSERRCMREIQNIEKDMPSTSKASFGLFGMDIDTEYQEIAQSPPSVAKKSDNKENIRSIDDAPQKISDLLQIPSTSLQYLTDPVLDVHSNFHVSKPSSEDPVTILQPCAGRKGSPAKRKQIRCFVPKKEQAVYKRLRVLQIKLSRCRNQKKKIAKSLKMAQNVLTNKSLLNTLDNMTTAGKTLTLLQFREQKKKGQGRRFSLKEKIMALSIYKQSPKSYKLLRKILLLPTPQTLDKVVREATIAPLYDKKVFKQLADKAKKMKENDKLCILLFDEVALQAFINYDVRDDRINGLVNEENTVKFANRALVFMLRGLIKNFKQPIAYTFCSGATNASKLKTYITEMIKKVQDAGFCIVAVVCDQGTNNQKAIKSLVQDNKIKKMRNGKELRQNTFEVNKSEIIPLYDPPHLLKGIRNNLLEKDLTYMNENGKQSTAKWQHIIMLYNENPAYKGLRILPKLTEQHVIKEKIAKMRVKFASQIFSQTVGLIMGYTAEKGILPAECKDTADLLIIFDKLFDSLNSSYGKKEKQGKPYLSAVTPTSPHNQLWQQTKKILKTMKFTDKDGKSRTTPTLENFIWTIEGIQYMIKKLAGNNVTSIWTRHLNQDPLENFFGSIRSHGWRNTNPSPTAFQSAYTALLINNLSSVHAAGNNCEEDFCECLESLIIYKNEKNKDQVQQINMEHLLIETTPLEEKKRNIKEFASLTYVSGFFLKICKKRIFKNCTICNNSLLNKNKDIEFLQYREYARRGWLCYPNENFIQLVSNIQDIFHIIIKDKFYEANLLQYIKLVIEFQVDTSNIINCTHKSLLINFVINYSLKFFVRSYCKDINKILMGRRKKEDNQDYLQTQAEMYYVKGLKIKKK